MFIVSVKPKKKTVIIVSAIVAAVILLIIGITVLSTAPASANGEKGSYSLEADGNAGKRALEAAAHQLGIQDGQRRSECPAGCHHRCAEEV